MTAKRRRRATGDAVARMKPKDRSKATFDLPPDLVAELRVASVLTGARNLSALAEEALRAELGRLRKKFNGGKPFPTPGKARAKRGRPGGS